MKLAKVVFLFLFFSVISLVSCKKTGVEEPPGASVAQIITGDANYTLLYHALERTGYLKFIGTTPNVTLFAPSNAAFISSGLTSEAIIDAVNLQYLQEVIGYHLAGRALPTSKIVAQGQLEMLYNYILTSNTISGVFINGVPLQSNYIAAANGVVYPLTRMLEPPSKTLQMMIDTDTTVSLFAHAVKRDSITIFTPATAFTFYTVFAPTNAAFRERNIFDTNQVNALGKARLDTLIKRHTISSSHLLTTDFVTGAFIKTMSDSSLSTWVGPPAYLAVPFPRQSKDVPIVKKDSIAINGVKHSIDTLLLR